MSYPDAVGFERNSRPMFPTKRCRYFSNHLRNNALLRIEERLTLTDVGSTDKGQMFDHRLDEAWIRLLFVVPWSIDVHQKDLQRFSDCCHRRTRRPCRRQPIMMMVDGFLHHVTEHFLARFHLARTDQNDQMSLIIHCPSSEFAASRETCSTQWVQWIPMCVYRIVADRIGCSPIDACVCIERIPHEFRWNDFRIDIITVRTGHHLRIIRWFVARCTDQSSVSEDFYGDYSGNLTVQGTWLSSICWRWIVVPG